MANLKRKAAYQISRLGYYMKPEGHFAAVTEQTHKPWKAACPALAKGFK